LCGARKLSCAAIAERPWLTIEWLPKYAPELNDIEWSWRDLKRHFLAHRTFPSVEHLEFAIKDAIIELNRERSRQMYHNQRIAAQVKPGDWPRHRPTANQPQAGRGRQPAEFHRNARVRQR